MSLRPADAIREDRESTARGRLLGLASVGDAADRLVAADCVERGAAVAPSSGAEVVGEAAGAAVGVAASCSSARITLPLSLCRLRILNSLAWAHTQRGLGARLLHTGLLRAASFMLLLEEEALKETRRLEETSMVAGWRECGENE